MFDRFNRKITYLRISVTDRCNLRCTYCMPEEGIPLLAHDSILKFEEIVDFTKYAVTRGVKKVRLTGGEPLVRKGIVGLVKEISSIEEIEDLSMTTNGILLDKFAHALKKAGLNRVNISMDTVNTGNYCKITREGNIEDVFRGIEAAQKAGLSPIKINCVLLGQENSEVQALKTFCEERGLQLRFIHQMNLRTGEFSKVKGGDGGNCSKCNRIRLLPNGDVKPCLFNGLAYNIRELGVEKAINLAIGNKPKAGTYNKSGTFNQIGG
ncbi:Cyclic pyranopterin phosphate synthase (MoaA) [hydrothermal vent metagenome]|uniref:Cyclic pyranopterin phosphate synthase (MoaA) n=1 Tax=hydrothermal vent metagenome TaxID=652676 RepID=A0A3B0UTK1_9ZZZZ